MKCKDCENFKVLFDPIRHYDHGRAVCKKYQDIVYDFMTTRQLNKLTCYGEHEEDKAEEDKTE